MRMEHKSQLNDLYTAMRVQVAQLGGATLAANLEPKGTSVQVRPHPLLLRCRIALVKGFPYLLCKFTIPWRDTMANVVGVR